MHVSQLLQSLCNILQQTTLIDATTRTILHPFYHQAASPSVPATLMPSEPATMTW